MAKPSLLYSHGLHSYGLYRYGPHSYGLCRYGPHSYGLCSYGLYRYDLHSYGVYIYGRYRYDVEAEFIAEQKGSDVDDNDDDTEERTLLQAFCFGLTILGC